MSMLTKFIYSILLRSYKKEAEAFKKDLACADKAQENLLLHILRENKDTEFGIEHKFAEITSVEEYRQCVPLRTYEDFRPMIESIAEGKDNVLTKERVKLFEITSGSVSASKLIPYTDGLKRQFQAGIKPWLWDLYTRYPQMKAGRSYWSITPVTHEKSYSSGGIPIGFEDDSEYLGHRHQRLMKHIFVKSEADFDTANDSEKTANMEAFYHKTSVDLLNAEDLTMISVWNPTYLTLILDYMQQNKFALCDELPDDKRARTLIRLQQKHYKRIWPNLQIISCWGDGAAQMAAESLQELFPNVTIQYKGILATEGFMTLPWQGQEGSILSIRSHFFEFCNVDTGEFYSYEKLQKDEAYEIIITTAGGLYRYCIRDIVKVVGFDRESELPLLRFAGKKEKVSDRFGEKLNEMFVLECIKKAGMNDGRFVLLAPEVVQKQDAENNSSATGYVLYTQQPKPQQNELLRSQSETAPMDKLELQDWKQLEEQLDLLLCENYHYDYCRKLGQLEAVKICPVTGVPHMDYLNHMNSKGQKLGDIKAAVLSLESGWEDVFELEDRQI